MKLSTVLKANASASVHHEAKKSLKGTDFETKGAYSDYLYSVDNLQAKVYAYKACTGKTQRAAMYAAAENTLSHLGVTADEKKAVMDALKSTDYFQAVRLNRALTAESRAAVNEAARAIRDIEARRTSDVYTVEQKASDLKAAQAAKDAVHREYQSELFTQTGKATFRAAFENNVGYILADYADKLTAAYVTEDEKKARKRNEERDKWTGRAAECNALGASIDAQALIAADNGNLSKLKAAVNSFYKSFTEAQAAAIGAITPTAAPTADTTATTAA